MEYEQNFSGYTEEDLDMAINKWLLMMGDSVNIKRIQHGVVVCRRLTVIIFYEFN